MQSLEKIPVQPQDIPDRLARGLAILRGAVILVFSIALIVAPEEVMPGSSGEPARTLALTFSSRSLLVSLAFIVFAVKRERQFLGWIFVGDALLQIFDTGMAVWTQKGLLAALPMAIGLLDAWAGLYLLRGRSNQER